MGSMRQLNRTGANELGQNWFDMSFRMLQVNSTSRRPRWQTITRHVHMLRYVWFHNVTFVLVWHWSGQNQALNLKRLKHWVNDKKWPGTQAVLTMSSFWRPSEEEMQSVQNKNFPGYICNSYRFSVPLMLSINEILQAGFWFIIQRVSIWRGTFVLKQITYSRFY